MPVQLIKEDNKLLLIIYFYQLIQLGLTLKVDGFTEQTALADTRAFLPCNTFLQSPDVSLVIWYRGITGKPLYTLDTRRMMMATLTTSPNSNNGNSIAPEDSDDNRFMFDTSTDPPSLVIDPVIEEDQGEYRCRIDYRTARTRNYVIKLNVVVPPKEVKILDSQGGRLQKKVGPLDEGSDLTLVCEAFGKPPPSITWWTPDETLLDENYLIVSPISGLVRNEIHLRNLNRSSLMVELICRAMNTNITLPTESSVFIDLNLRPLEVRISTPKRAISSGNMARFECHALGSRPPPMISWWIGSIKMNEVQQTVSSDGNLTTSVLSFIPNLSDNGKHITCRVENPSIEGSIIENGTTLIVHYLPQLRLALGPNINGDAIREGSDVYLECHIVANPSVYEVTWLLEETQLFSDVSKGIIIANQSLVLQKVRRQSRGTYRCGARNEEGTSRSNPLFLRVQFAPVCRTRQKVPFAVARNELTHISCEVDADPTNVSFKWFLNNSSETIEIRSFLSNGTKSVVSYSPRTRFGYGSLFCQAENEIGKQVDPCVFQIIPAGPPQPVKNCVITNHSMNSILLECVPGDSGGLRQSFFVEVYNKQLEEFHSNYTSVDRPIFLIENLPPGSTFSLLVYASNSKGRSASMSILGATLGPPERQTSQTLLEDNYFSQELIIWAIVACAFVFIVMIMTIVWLKVASSRRSPSRRGGRAISAASSSAGGNKGEGRAKADDEREFDKFRAQSDFLGSGGGIVNGEDGLHREKESKCEVICTSNDEGFVSIEYKTNPWETHLGGPRSETVLVSTPYKTRSIENQYSTSSSVLYQPTVEVIRYETEPRPSPTPPQLSATTTLVVDYKPDLYLDTQTVSYNPLLQHHSHPLQQQPLSPYHQQQQQHIQQQQQQLLQQHQHQLHHHPNKHQVMNNVRFSETPLRESPIADGCSETEPIEFLRTYNT